MEGEGGNTVKEELEGCALLVRLVWFISVPFFDPRHSYAAPNPQSKLNLTHSRLHVTVALLRQKTEGCVMWIWFGEVRNCDWGSFAGGGGRGAGVKLIMVG